MCLQLTPAIFSNNELSMQKQNRASLSSTDRNIRNLAKSLLSFCHSMSDNLISNIYYAKKDKDKDKKPSQPKPKDPPLPKKDTGEAKPGCVIS